MVGWLKCQAELEGVYVYGRGDGETKGQKP